MRDNYLIHGANALVGALNYIDRENPKEYDPRSVGIFLNSACNTLKELIDDERTISLISSTDTKINQHKNDFTEFLEKFSIADKALMVSAGMNQKMANYLFKDLQKLKNISNTKHDFHKTKNIIEEFTYSVCSEGNKFKKIKASQETKSIVKRSISVIGGGSIFLTNLSADTVLSGAASSISMAWGGHLFFDGLSG